MLPHNLPFVSRLSRVLALVLFNWTLDIFLGRAKRFTYTLSRFSQIRFERKLLYFRAFLFLQRVKIDSVKVDHRIFGLDLDDIRLSQAKLTLLVEPTKL